MELTSLDRAPRLHATEALWAAEQALSCVSCATVLLWLKGTDDRWLRR